MTRPAPRLVCAFTAIDLLVLVVCIVLLLVLLIPAFINARSRSRSVCCNCNLKQVGLAYRTWALDHTNYPQALSATNGGTLEYIGQGKTWLHFAVMSNELSTPIILVCPDDNGRLPAKTFSPSESAQRKILLFSSNTNLTYFVGLDAREDIPNALLSGDRWVGLMGTQLKPGVHSIYSNSPLRWVGGKGHKAHSNIGLADGSVQQVDSSRLTSLLQYSELATNRLEIP